MKKFMIELFKEVQNQLVLKKELKAAETVYYLNSKHIQTIHEELANVQTEEEEMKLINEVTERMTYQAKALADITRIRKLLAEK